MSDPLHRHADPEIRWSVVFWCTIPFMPLIVGTYIWIFVTVPEIREELLDAYRRLLTGICIFAAGIYGPRRLVRHHPYLNLKYREWLKRTPWRWPLPLPLGPVTLGWRDVIVLGGLSAAVGSLGEPQWMWLPPAIAVWLYCLLAAGCSHRALWELNGLSIGLAATFMFGPWVLAAVYLVAHSAVRKSLQHFHELTRQIDEPDRISTKVSTVGWPYASLHPRFARLTAWHGAALLSAGHVSWWVLAVIVGVAGTPFMPSHNAHAFVFPVVYAMLAGLIRLKCYDLHSPPIDLWGRWALRRWIVWEYDRVFLPPIAVLAVAFVLMRIAPSICPYPGIVVPFGFGLVTYLAMILPPSPIEWELTGGRNLNRSAGPAADLMQAG